MYHKVVMLAFLLISENIRFLHRLANDLASKLLLPVEHVIKQVEASLVGGLQQQLLVEGVVWRLLKLQIIEVIHQGAENWRATFE